MNILGIDIGGSGIKGAIVETSTGELITERIRIETPQPATPVLVAETVEKLVRELNWKGNVGCGFPSVVINGIIKTASNIDKNWIGVNAQDLFERYTHCKVKVLNDADAAGEAEMKMGAGIEKNGVVIMITIGTGIGTALFIDGKLVPNTEFGHIIMHDDIAEKYASGAVREKNDMSWDKWGKRVNEYLLYIEKIINPELIILGGGVSKKFNKFSEYLKVNCNVLPAKFYNNAGIIGAAMSARTI